jgi:hypothetical protein
MWWDPRTSQCTVHDFVRYRVCRMRMNSILASTDSAWWLWNAVSVSSWTSVCVLCEIFICLLRIQPRFDTLKCYLTLNVFVHYRRYYYPRPSLHGCLVDSQDSTGVTDQAFLIHSSAKNVLSIRLVVSITAFFIRIYRAERRLSSVKLSCNLFRISPLVDCTSGVI